MKKQLSILGCTGSIGTQCLDVVRHFPEQFSVKALSANRNIAVLKEQLIEFKPELVSISSEAHANELRQYCKEHHLNTDVLYGSEGLITVASTSTDLLVVSIVGTSGIQATYKAIEAKNPIALACKEVLVSAGDLIMAKAKENKVPIIPIDSEHAAIKQCLDTIDDLENNLQHIILTASGGPFRTLPFEKFQDISIEQTLKHPNWDMGQKISVDSATMVNKGLEIIEAHHLFNIPFEKIKVIIHPQSIIHGIVEFIDGNILAHLSPTDMRFPIQYALSYPNKNNSPFERLNFFDIKEMTFEKVDSKRFPLLNTAIECGKRSGTYPVVFNAANESAVQLFLEQKIHFTDIQTLIHDQLDRVNHSSKLSLEDIIALDKEIKEKSLEYAL